MNPRTPTRVFAGRSAVPLDAIPLVTHPGGRAYFSCTIHTLADSIARSNTMRSRDGDQLG